MLFRSKEFGRIATQNAKNVILQKIREAVSYTHLIPTYEDLTTGGHTIGEYLN